MGVKAASVLVLYSFLSLTTAAPPPPEDTSQVWWIFLTKGPNRETLDRDVAQKLQAEHVGNLGRLGDLGVGLMAGPLGDDGFIRGIVVVRAPDRNTVTEYFKPDPFVQKGRLAVVASPWLIDAERIGKHHTPFSLAEHTLVVFRKGTQWKEPGTPPNRDFLHALLPVLRDLEKNGDLALCGPLADGGDVLGIALFRPKDAAPIRQQLSRETAVKGGVVVVETHPQYLGAGVLGGGAPTAVK